MSQRPKKGILALSSCHLLHLILAGVGDWNKSSHLRLPPKRESIYLHMSHKPKKGTCSVLLPSPSPHFGGSWRLEQKFTSPTPAKKIELSPHVTKTKEGDPCSVILPSPSKRYFLEHFSPHITSHEDQRRGSLLCPPAVSFTSFWRELEIGTKFHISNTCQKDFT